MSNIEEIAKKNLETREFVNTDEVQPKSLGKVETPFSNESKELAIPFGYVEIYPENFPSKGLFYDKSVRFFIKSATTGEIRHFSTMNDEDPMSINEALNEIIKRCLTVRTPGKIVSYKDIKEEDRFYIILAIRELTFLEGENNIILQNVCNDCENVNDIPLTKDLLITKDLTETASKYYNPETRQFEYNTKSSGTIVIQPPSIGVSNDVAKYTMDLQMNGKKIDKAFIGVLPYMVSDWRKLNSKTIKSLHTEFLGWSAIKYQTMLKLIEESSVSIEEHIKTFCECGSELHTQITFPNGIKSLFLFSSIDNELI